MAEPIKLRFHKSLYEAGAIDKAVERFAALGTFSVEEHDSDWIVNVEPARESLRDRIGDELGNHALFHSILARRGA